jgi:2-polyprenyl-3-methyl-5-hydroxy-6-metoxy-1,4-benzoquinol methylase
MPEHGTSCYSWIERQKLKSPQPVILERLAAVPRADRAATRVLDIPAGNGVITIPLAAAGFDVTGCDLFPEYAERNLAAFREYGIEEAFRKSCKGFLSGTLAEKLFPAPPIPVPKKCNVVKGDMEAPLPFDDNSFDIALCIEGIEHVDAQHRLVQELQRVLKPGGTLIVSTPNVLCLRSRTAYLLAGQRTVRSFVDEFTEVHDQSADGQRVYHGHVFMISYFQLRYALHNNGFRIQRLLSAATSPTSLALAPFLTPFVALYTLLAARHAARRFSAMADDCRIPQATPRPYPEIVRHVLSPALLFGNITIVEARTV